MQIMRLFYNTMANSSQSKQQNLYQLDISKDILHLQTTYIDCIL